MMRKCNTIENVHHLENGQIAAFDPRHEIIGQIGRRGDAAVAEQLDDQLADQRVVGRADRDVRRRREPRAQVRQR